MKNINIIARNALLFVCTIFISALPAEAKRIKKQVQTSVTSPANLPSYYSDLNNKSGSGLWTAVQDATLIGWTGLSYDGLWTAYKTTDTYPTGHTNAGKIWDMYSNCSFTYPTSKCVTYSKECDCYNREHSIPKSWFGGSTSSPGADIFHIVPTDGKVNGTRSNYAFGEVSSATYSYAGAKLGTAKSISIENTIEGSYTANQSGTVFEPIDEYKGDFARGYFGTLLRWAGKYQSFTSGDGAKIFSGDYTATGGWGLTKYGIALLLKWHRQDPVSQKEIDRNNGIQQEQGNRNPFIDYPDLAEYIWGSHAGETFVLAAATATFSEDYDPTTGTGGSTEVEPYKLVLVRNGMETESTQTGSYTLPTTSDEADACEGWTFAGWFNQELTATTTTKPTFITTVSSATTLYAVYSLSETTESEGDASASTVTINAKDLKAASGTSQGITLTSDKGGGTSEPAYNEKNSDIRIYANGTIAVSAESEITQIMFNLSEQGKKRLAPITANVGSVAEQASNDETVTWTGSANSVTFTVGAKAEYGTDGSKSAGQLCFSSVSVTTGGSAGGTTTTITYTTSPECEIEQTNATASFAMSEITISYGETAENQFTTNSKGEVVYSSSDETVAKVNVKTGEVTVLNVGHTTITATVAETKYYFEAKAEYLLTVEKATPMLSLDDSYLTTMKVGQSDVVIAYTNIGTPQFSSSDEAVATVDAAGQIKALKAGKTTIAATISETDNYFAASVSYELTVMDIVKYIVTWVVDDAETQVEYNENELLMLPKLSVANCSDSQVFVGWTKEAEYESDEAPLDLFKTASGEVTNDATYYALFATEGEGTASVSGSVEKTSFSAVEDNLDDNISYKAEQGSANTEPRVIDSVVRIYQNGGTLTVSAVDGVKMNSITIGSAMKTTISYSIDGGEESQGQSITANGTFPLNDIEASTVLFTCKGTDQKSRLYLNKLAVNYSTTGTSTTYTGYTTHCPKASYIIAFLNWDNEQLYEIEVEEGTMPEYGGATPQRADDDEYTYTWSGWTPELDFATEDMTYTATFNAMGKIATIIESVTYGHDVKVYTITGQKVNSAIQSLPQGTYIILTDGLARKVLIK